MASSAEQLREAYSDVLPTLEVGDDIGSPTLRMELGSVALSRSSLIPDPESAGIRRLMEEAHRHDQEFMAA